MPETLATPIPGNGVVHPDPVIAHPVGAYHVLRLLPSDPYTRKLFPAYVERCIGFIDRTGSDTDPIWLGNLLYSNFYQATNYLNSIIALDQQERIVGHCLAYVENFQKLGNHIHLLQLEKDEGGPDILEQGLKMIEEWGKSLGLKLIVNSAEPGARPRLYHRYGFKDHRMIQIKEIL